MIRTAAVAAALLFAAPALAQSPPPPVAKVWLPSEGDFSIANFRFHTGEVLPELRQHYRTLGTPKRDAAGNITNAVMVLHGTGGTGAQFLQPHFADELYGPGQPLDITRMFIILPDAIGHGASSKPSDGLRMAFPAYDYADMVTAQHRLLTEHFGVKQLRLLMGTSMGCMMDFVFGTAYPGFARAIMPTACLPVELAGRNRMWRKISIDAIKADPVWNSGNYSTQPVMGMRTAAAMNIIAGSVPLRLQAEFPTRVAAEKAIEGRIEAGLATTDANDTIYRLDASRNYNPAPELAKIIVPVTWINSADDFINPPLLGIAEREVGNMPNAVFRLIPETPEGRGHSTHTWAQFWKDDLVALLARSE